MQREDLLDLLASFALSSNFQQHFTVNSDPVIDHKAAKEQQQGKESAAKND